MAVKQVGRANIVALPSPFCFLRTPCLRYSWPEIYAYARSRPTASPVSVPRHGALPATRHPPLATPPPSVVQLRVTVVSRVCMGN
ncbi:protein of unknown function [Candidatus Promineifilum breve]|uniref:Uncharacterized protein n=1 Tax=Candidatus Promineifilum breve TaxID=1806508 RepID=A0A160T2Y9_9CHLR|nr:protein of unknown function [Candidatus Promineifilum breve]